MLVRRSFEVGGQSLLGSSSSAVGSLSGHRASGGKEDSTAATASLMSS